MAAGHPAAANPVLEEGPIVTLPGNRAAANTSSPARAPAKSGLVMPRRVNACPPWLSASGARYVAIMFEPGFARGEASRTPALVYAARA